MGMQVSFQPLMPRTGPELWTLFIPPSSRGHYLSYRRAGTLSPKEEWPAGEELPPPGLSVHCALSHVCCVSLWKGCLPYVIPHCWEPVEISQTFASNYACPHSLTRGRKPKGHMWSCGPKSVKTASLW